MAQIDQAWLRDALRDAGYDVSDGTEGSIRAKHSVRPNVIAKVRDNLNAITFVHVWGRKKGFLGGGDGAFRTAVNNANRRSWLSIFSVDGDGDLLVSSYIYIADGLTPSDVDEFLDRESQSFKEIVVLCELHKHLQ